MGLGGALAEQAAAVAVPFSWRKQAWHRPRRDLHTEGNKRQPHAEQAGGGELGFHWGGH